MQQFEPLDDVEKFMLAQERQDIGDFLKRTCQPGDVIQIAPTAAHGFEGCLAMVEDVAKWGVTAFVQSVTTKEARYYVRLEWSMFEYIGKAVFLPEDLLSDGE
jgi:hypothetical protein